jgi:hypothetical protein
MNKTETKKYNQKYYLSHREKIKHTVQKYRQKHKKHLSETQRKWHQEHKDRDRISKRKYYKNNKKVCKERATKWNKSHFWRHVYSALKCKSHRDNFPLEKLIPKEEFFKWLKLNHQKCTYCDLEDLSLSSIQQYRTKKRFQIDRKNNNIGYEKDNICWACPTCNFLKSSVFTYQEWKEIAQKYIKPKWMAK